MTRKTSTYARKKRLHGDTFNGAEAFNAIQRCRAYTLEPIPGMAVEGTMSAADKARGMVRTAFESIKSGDATTKDYDILCHAMGVSGLRAIQIAGEDEFTNTMLPIIKAANEALERTNHRFNRISKWGFDGPALEAVDTGIYVYETILLNSSPAQMAAVSEMRRVLLEEAAREMLESAL